MILDEAIYDPNSDGGTDKALTHCAWPYNVYNKQAARF